MLNTTGNLWENAIFMPHDSSLKSDELLEKVYEKRQASFVAFSLSLVAREMMLCRETDFIESFNSFKKFNSDERRHILKNPLFNVWLKQTIGIQQDKAALREKLLEFRRLLSDIDEKDTDSARIIIEGKPVFVKRYDIDSSILEFSSPEYSLPDEKRRIEFEQNVVYPESFFQEMLAVALERIKYSWYEAYRDFPKFVHTVVDMIDGDYTSYSAAEHTGVIFVSTDNSPLAALEEFLIHEFGHQILYHLMELDPVVNDAIKETYKLPWSGNERDFYGYFHAFYIYILIANYLRRVKYRSSREQRRISKRFAHVVEGLRKTVDIFDKTDGFTIYGRNLFENLKSEVERLENSTQN